ncbi:Vacuolar protein sorting-associated protein 20 [Tilletia horrida]|nr:Vacuolar protein sorting-associated protein 20 [Tilletia horrida]
MGAGNSKSSVKITAQDRAILDLKLQRDKIRQYRKKLQAVADRDHALAKDALARGERQKALTALRRRKYQESLLAKTETQLSTLEELVSNIEFSQIQQSVMLGLQQGNDVLRSIHKELSIEKVDKLMEETAEAQAYQKEVEELLASRMTAEEEDAVQQEMRLLEQEAGIATKAPPISNTPLKDDVRLPDAPTQEPVDASAQTAAAERQQRARELARAAEEPLLA